MPGICHPKDIKRLFPADTLKESLQQAFATGNFSIDRWEGDIPQYYIRPATVRGVGKIYDLSWGGECTFLTSTGCKFSFEDRPHTCKLLEPSEEGGCSNHLKESEKLYMGKIWKKEINLSQFWEEL
jgi:hypothetical protein